MPQAGAKPFVTTAADSVTVSVNDDTSKKVGAYWQDLIQSGAVSTDPDFTERATRLTFS